MSKDFITQSYLSWLNDETVCKYLETTIPYSREALEAFISLMISNNVYFWAICLKETEKHIGNIKIDPINKKNKTGEYGILMGDKDSWGKGYAKEASNAIIDFCFTKLNLRKITLGVIENNIAAVKLYLSIGFKVEGIYQMHGKYDGVFCNALRMAIFNHFDTDVQNFFSNKT